MRLQLLLFAAFVAVATSEQRSRRAAEDSFGLAGRLKASLEAELAGAGSGRQEWRLLAEAFLSFSRLYIASKDGGSAAAKVSFDSDGSDPDACVDESRQCKLDNAAACKKNLYTGRKATTMTGRKCQAWGEQSPHRHGHGDLEGNFCRNPDGENGPWCYTTDRRKRWELCFPDCLGDGPLAKGSGTGCVDEARQCKKGSLSVCKKNEYTGRKATTLSGRTCQAWGEQSPHRHSHGDLEGNFCRNPDGENGPWCYTTDPQRRWEPCFADCPDHATDAPDPATACVDEEGQCKRQDRAQACKQNGYFGKKATTVTGKKCQAWISQSPHRHGFPAEESNFCRNPDHSDGPWCYTTDPNHRWEYCFPYCPKDSVEEADASTACVDAARKCTRGTHSQCKKDDYAGRKSTTASGKTCQAWDAQTPHRHSHKYDKGTANYCRNPAGDYDGGPWCYTMEKGKRWERCFPACD